MGSPLHLAAFNRAAHHSAPGFPHDRSNLIE